MERIYFKHSSVSRKDILEAVRRFDGEFAETNDYERWLQNTAYKYAVWHSRRLYPPKRMWSWASGIEVLQFNGGEQTNRVFRQLGFEVSAKP